MTGLPVEATVTAGPFSAAASPATGSYDLMLPEGTYDVEAKGPGHYGASVTGVVAVQGDTTIQDFALDPFARALADDVESGNIGWTAEPSWAIVTNQSHSPVSSWHESPGGDSPDNANISLEAPPLDFRGSTGVRLAFWHRYTIESNYDYGRVEWSSDGGASWHEVATYTGTQSSWSRVRDPAAGSRRRRRRPGPIPLHIGLQHQLRRVVHRRHSSRGLALFRRLRVGRHHRVVGDAAHD